MSARTTLPDARLACRFCKRVLTPAQVEPHVARAHITEAVRAWAIEWRFKGEDFEAWCVSQWVKR